MSEERGYVAVDLGAGSGRVVLGRFGSDSLELEVVHRFPQPTSHAGGHDRWVLKDLLAEVERGLLGVGERIRERPADLRSIGVDSWGVDFGLLDENGELLDDPVRYRDPRTDGLIEELCRLVPREELYAVTGIQFLPFNTLVQLLAVTREGGWPPAAAKLLMMPDLVHHHLSGRAVGEETNASTTQALAARTRTWAPELLRAVGVPLDVMPELVPPGSSLGPLRPELQERLGLPSVTVVCPATHDTASAVAGTPLEEGWAYISSGTWSLVGVEVTEPVLTPEACDAGFTNEAGVFGTIRLLTNCMGLWILESCREVWESRGELLPYDVLLERMPEVAPAATLIEVDDQRFLHPPDMVEEIAAHLRERGCEPPADQVVLSRTILDSLAARYAVILKHLAALTGRPVRGVQIVGGGSQNDYLNQAAALATGLPVRAGPVEATAIGNLALQAIHDGLFPDLAAARGFIGRVLPTRDF